MISLTDSAIDKVRELFADEEAGTALRVGVTPGGCSGFSYEMYPDTNVDALADMVKDYGEVKVVVDRESLPMIEGAEVDYIDGLQGAGFKINNPNVTRSCGCGNSFS